MATMEERRKANREFLFGSDERRRKNREESRKKMKAAAEKNKAAKAAKDKKRVESRKAINEKIIDKNKKRGRMIPKALPKEERRRRLKDRVNKKATSKRPSGIRMSPPPPGIRKAPPATDKGGRSAVPGTMRGKQVDTKMGPNMSKVTKVTAADRKKPKGGADNRSTLQKLFGASEEKRKLGRNMQKRAQASMGLRMNKGGSLKTPTNPGLKKLPTEVRNKMGFMNKGGKVKKMKHGGRVGGKCKVDGIAIRGKTRAKTK